MIKRTFIYSKKNFCRIFYPHFSINFHSILKEHSKKQNNKKKCMSLLGIKNMTLIMCIMMEKMEK